MRRWLWIGVCIFFVLFSLYPTWYEIQNRHRLRPNRYFELIHNFPTDYNFYLSRIRQGIEGRWTVVEKYTSEPHQGTFIHIFYLALGWAGAANRVPWERAGDVYHMARIALGFTLLSLTAYLARLGFRHLYWQMLAFFLAVTASTWPKIVSQWDGWRFGGYMPWWSVMDSLQRITFLPHLLFGQAIILFLLIALANKETMQKPYNWIFLGILGFVMGIVFPPGILFVDVTLVVIVFLELLMEIKGIRGSRRIGKTNLITWGLRHVVPASVFILLSAPSLLYLMLMTSFYPWRRLAELDVIQPLPFAYAEYLKAVGPILPLGLAGLVIALVKKERTMLVNSAWVLSWMALLIIFKAIPQQSPLRFSEMIPHIPLGMLTAYLFFSVLMTILSGRFGKAFFGDVRYSAHQFQNSILSSLSEGSLKMKLNDLIVSLQRAFSAPKNVSLRALLGYCFFSVILVLPVLLVFLNLGIMHSSWKWQRDFVDHKIRAEFPLVPTGSYVMYPLKDFIGAMKFIQDASKRTDVILTQTAAGNYMPVYSGNTVYVGHDNTVDAATKKARVQYFYSGAMPVLDAQLWMEQEKFRYIYYGPQEREDNNWNKRLEQTYPFLIPVFENDFVTVYEPNL